ncbi:MAG: transcription antitermination protein NusB [Vicingus serpentipes]|nr:transcription antitermination protein NusB [Vicingus serpentipes]
MLSRRFLRIKIFQALYAYFQSDGKNSTTVEKELFLSLERMFDLYLFFLIIGKELVHHSKLKMEDAKQKRLPTEEDLNPNTKFIDNQVFNLLTNNPKLNELITKRKVTWDADQELATKLFNFLRKHEVYTNYMSTRETTFEEDQKFVIDIYKKVIPEFDLLLSEINDKSIYWGYDEMDFVLSMVLKTLKKLNAKSNASAAIMPLYRDEKEDILFVKELFQKTIAADKENAVMIAEKTKNWDVDRIAMVDILLMKMALTEFIFFKSVPVKVTLNEYIDLSKWYSTPKSKAFINGVLDKLVEELKGNGKLKKTGRGLLE